ncbi:MAG TPA: SDR family oxidoreductase [Anaeromyxobacteraceae bacterium]
MAKGLQLRSPLTLATAALLGGLAWLRSRRRVSLRGSCVVVTGGSRGLGLVLARELADAGARLVLCARDGGELEAARRDVEARGAEVLAVPCDVTDRDEVRRLFAAAEERFGRVDVLVNNASIIQVAPAETLSLRDLEAAVAANFWATVYATLEVLPRMRERGSGRIVNVTSIGGTVAVPHLLGYTSGKFAAVGFSSGLAVEAAKDGIAVTTVVPGLMRTGSFLNALVKGRRAEEATLFSIASSLPVLTMSARRAARRIVLACERGEGFVTLGVPAKMLRLASALAPNLTADVLSIAARLLPGPGGDRAESRAEPAWMHRRGPTFLTALGEQAATENNEQPVFRH